MFSFTVISFCPRIFYFALVLYLTTAVVIFLNSLPILIQFFLLITLILQAKYYFKRYVFLTHPKSIIALWKTDSEFWSLQQFNQDVIQANLRSNSIITQFLIVLNFRLEKSRCLSLLVTPKSLGYENYRRLLVHLYHE